MNASFAEVSLTAPGYMILVVMIVPSQFKGLLTEFQMGRKRNVDTRTGDLFAPRPKVQRLPPPSPLLRVEKIEARPSQYAAIAAAQDHNCFGVIAPTGTGKTYIAIRIADMALARGHAVLMTAPTTPLCAQHAASFRACFNLPPESIQSITGRVNRQKRQIAWSTARIVVSTPQIAANDIERNILDLKRFGLVIIDEAHLAVERYAAITVANVAQSTGCNILGLTAGDDDEALERVRNNLHLETWIRITEETTQIERPPIHEHIERIALPEELTRISAGFYAVLGRLRRIIAKTKLIEPSMELISTRTLKGLRDQISVGIRERRGKAWYEAMTALAAYWKLVTAATYAITEDYATGLAALDALATEEKPAARRLRATPEVKTARASLRDLVERNVAHPKQVMAASLVREALDRWKPNPRILVYDRFIKPAPHLAAYLAATCGVRVETIFGQSTMKTERAVELLTEFTHGEFPVLVATQVVRQGIHVPDINELLEYSPPLNGTEYVQLRGRTGRTQVGHVTMLIMDDAFDRRLAFSARARGKKIMAPRGTTPTTTSAGTAIAIRTSHFTHRQRKTEFDFVAHLPKGLIFERFAVRSIEVATGRTRPYVQMTVGDRTGNITLLHWCPYGGKQAEEIAQRFAPGSIIIVAGTHDPIRQSIAVSPTRREYIALCPAGDFDPADYERRLPF